MLSQRARALAPSPTMAIDARAKELLSQGVDVVNFSVGEPDFDTPETAKTGGIEAIRSGFTKYTPAAGTLELRRAVAKKLREENSLEYAPEEIVLSNGAKQALYNAYMVLLDPGDEVILQAPYWVSYPEMIRLAGGVPVVVETDESTGFKMTPEMIREKLTPRTRAINLNNPSNPTGAVYTEEELKAIAEIAVERNLVVISDEVYEKLVYDGVRFVSVAALDPEVKRRTVTVNGFSKAYAMTGWRLGYAAAERPIARAMADLQSQTTSGPSSITQKAALAALQGDQGFLEEMRREFDRRRLYMLERLRSMPGIRVDVVPQGAFYLFPNVSGLFGATIRGRRIASSDDLAMVLLEEAKVAAVPGTGFGAPNYLRFSYATSMERIREGMDRMAALLKEAV
ncbi:MAG: pyridoxal phosphate-dependent aminotransferase [Bacillota bacterium]|nr:MAG: aspartate aminotransferase [Bacillota bacterium]